MPELPEVETTRLGLLPRIVGKRIQRVTVREHRLRWPIPRNLSKLITGKLVTDIQRRGKYLLWNIEAARDGGFLLCHLGMSGSLFSVRPEVALAKHDHVDFVLDDNSIIRYHDPRRFGSILWIPGETPEHPLLDSLGPEPLSDAFDGGHLFNQSRGRSISVKEFIMSANVVVGVGNIYASESLFGAGIRATTPAGRISKPRYIRLADAIKTTLAKALAAGGSSLRDYVQADGKSGYFQLATMVYDREGETCRNCASIIRALRQGQRSTYYCPRCQT